MIEAAKIGDVVALPIETECDRVVLPVSNPHFFDQEPRFVPDVEFGGWKIDPPTFVFYTFERTLDGWRRVA